MGTFVQSNGFVHAPCKAINNEEEEVQEASNPASQTWGGMNTGEMTKMATEALKNMQDTLDMQGIGMKKSPSAEMLLRYNSQPLHVRSRAEQWELLRTEITLKQKLGEGDGGVIHLAQWRGLDVVAKMLKTETIPGAERDLARADLINEICVISRLRHPNLVMFLGACTIGEPLVILNELMVGGSLEDYMHSKRNEKNRPWQPSALILHRWCIELARALCFLHNCTPTIIHRDLKPANLLLNEDLHLKVGDFGLSKVKDSYKNGTYRMTGKTGSMRYMAPEVFQDDPTYDEKVDIYSTGIIMWYMANGHRPFDRMPGDVVAQRSSTQGLRPPLELITTTYGEGVSMIVEKCWNGIPDLRPSASDLVDDLEALAKQWEKKLPKKKDGKGCVIS